MDGFTMSMNTVIELKNATFVGTKNSNGYETVINNFSEARTIRILTYSLSSKADSFRLEKLRNLSAETDLKLIFALPNLTHIQGKYGSYTEKSLRDEMNKVLSILSIERFVRPPCIGVSFKNHAKIIGTEHIVYVGSANYSDASYYNAEAGVLIRDKQAIQEIYHSYIDRLPIVRYSGNDWDWFKILIGKCVSDFEFYTNRLKNYEQFNEDLLTLSSELGDYLQETKKHQFVSFRDIFHSMGNVGCNSDISELLEDAENIIDDILANDEFWRTLDSMSSVEDGEEFNGLYREKCGLIYEEPGYTEYISEDEVFIPLYDQCPEEIISIVEELWPKRYGNDENINAVLTQMGCLLNILSGILDLQPTNFEEKFTEDVVSQGSNQSILK